MRNKIVVGLLAFTVLFSVTACGSKKSEENTKKSEPKVTTKKSSKNLVQAKIDETVILDKKGLKVTAKSISYDKYETTIKLLIENNSDKDLTVQTEGFSINGIMISDYFSASVASGKKANDEISFYTEDLAKANIKGIKDIEFTLLAFETSSFDDYLEEKGVKLETDIKDYTQEYNKKGKVIFDDKDIKIYYLNTEKNEFGDTVFNIYVENNSNKNIGLILDDESVNGYMVDAYLSANLNPGKKIYTEIEFDKDDFKENNIKDIETFEFKLSVLTDDYDYIVNDDNIKLEF